MKLTKIALLAAALTACSTKPNHPNAAKNPSYPSIPAELQLDEKSLKSLSDTQDRTALAILRAIGEIEFPEKHIFTKFETEEQRAEREEKFEALNEERRQVIAKLQQDCTSDEEKNELADIATLKAGDNATAQHSARITTQACGLRAAIEENTLLTIIDINDDTKTKDYGTRHSAAHESALYSEADQRTMGYAHIRSSVVAQTRTEIEDGLVKRQYLETDGNALLHILADSLGDIGLTIKTRALGGAELDEVIHTIEIARGSLTATLTVIKTRAEDGTVETKHLLGDRLLTEEEVAELGNIPFQVKL